MEPMNYSDGVADKVLVEEHCHVKKVVLNRPKQLNAVSLQMVYRLLELFLACEEDCSVKLIILKGKGGAFSVGGDVAAVFRDVFAMPEAALGLFPDIGSSYFLPKLPGFFEEERARPFEFVAASSVKFGAILSSHRQIRNLSCSSAVFQRRRRLLKKKEEETDKSLEIETISHQTITLSAIKENPRCQIPPQPLGGSREYLGLTSSRLDGAEMLACGLATHFVPEARLSLLEEAICNANSSDPAIISAIIDEFSQQPRLKEKSVYHQLDIINNCFSRRTVEEILLALERETVNSNSGWISSTIKSLKAASPTSLKIALRSIRQGRLQGVGQCLISEYRIVCHILQGKVSKDFTEGCRAILLDKDKNPKWEPIKLELVSDEMVDRYFSKLDDEDWKDWKDLKLPTRSNLPAHAIAKL
ncbi:hypothetical protein Vadar_018233 [Vaccinium darrowii]|uniref:Uncharacterized protein n=1 Tax=Vaccinium darrowii TaxID=229202 RepID=A0ACB7ZD31_9ERIC|nr:hypothetical protein Vadar_018233 [Vaccinium darrowii]